MLFSIIVPVYNRPTEIKELLDSLVCQDYAHLEVIIIEDGSEITCGEIVEAYKTKLTVDYYYQENRGQGFARNFGMTRAKGDYFVLFDSDCIIPPHYFSVLRKELSLRMLDAHGGPDAAAQDFSPFQKALNLSMASFLTTGSIRGKLKDPAKYQARGFNMGLSPEVFQATGGFVDPNKGEDIELSIRIKEMGFKLQLVEQAFVFHKRRNNLRSFLSQSFSFGRNRINVSRYHPGSVKLVHFLPVVFLAGWIGWALLSPISFLIFYAGSVIFGIWTLGILIAATFDNRSIGVGLIAIVTSYGQLFSYGAGLAWEGLLKGLRG